MWWNLVFAVSLSFSRFSGSPSGPMMLASGYSFAHGEMKMWCSKSGAIRYRTVPDGPDSASCWTLALASEVNATGLKTAIFPVFSFTIVARPPILTMPKRRNGVLSVVMAPGTTSRITISESGLCATNLWEDLAMP